MSRRSGRRGRRAYQPLPQRNANWGARLLILFVGLALVVGALALTFGR